MARDTCRNCGAWRLPREGRWCPDCRRARRRGWVDVAIAVGVALGGLLVQAWVAGP